MKKYQVFISSTYRDLVPHRQAAVAAILENGHIPAGMELFAAGDEEQMRVIRRWIDESDIFMLILGGRYGTIEPKSGMSYTHLEYQYAVERSKPHFAIVLTDKSRDTRIAAGESAANLHEQVAPQAYKDFCGVVTSKMCAFADDDKDIKLGVWQSIRDLERRHELAGWVSSREIPDNSRVLADVAASAKHSAQLEAENRALAKQVVDLKEDLSQRAEFGGRTFEDLAKVLGQTNVQLKLAVDKEPVNTDLFTALFTFADFLASGVSNAVGVKQSEKELFRKIASPLFSFGLTQHAKVPSRVSWSRFTLSKTGQAFVAEARIRAATIKSENTIPNSDGEG